MAYSDAYNRRVTYYYDPEIGNLYYGKNHPMKPHRITVAHDLIVNYGLYKKMEIYKPGHAMERHMMKFHTEDYISFLKSINYVRVNNDLKGLMDRFEIGTKENDCPVFVGVFKFAQISAGGSLSAAQHINNNCSDIAINWAGGLHHAKKSKASGFCYVNDIVLCIIELLKFHKRVLYVDIDVHHGDGVEEAFYNTNRVMTVSFHQYGKKFFPGTGGLNNIGTKEGIGYAVNVPLKEGITDKDYENVFCIVMSKVLTAYDPNVIVLQCGSDSITGDQLGNFNLTLNAHGYCISFLRKYNLPMILLGGGGYTISNVSRCWCYDTAKALNENISNSLPSSEYMSYFKPDYRLHIASDPTIENCNTKEYLNDVIIQVCENLQELESVPSVQFFNSPMSACDSEFLASQAMQSKSTLDCIVIDNDSNCIVISDEE